MKLIKTADISEWDVVRRFGYRPWPGLIMLLIVVGLPTALLLRSGGSFLGGNHWPVWKWAIVSPVLLVAGLLWLLIVWMMWRMFVAGLRSSNWVMKAGGHGVYLKFRSYLNSHFPDDGPTVVFVEFEEIASARKVRHYVRGVDSKGDATVRGQSYLELRLKHTETNESKRAVASEATVKNDESGRSLSRFHHRPVWVAEPGLIRVDWRGPGMLRAMPPQVAIEPTAKTGDISGTSEERGRADDRIVELIEQGQRMSAIRLIRRQYHLSLRDAREFVDELTSRTAQLDSR